MFANLINEATLTFTLLNEGPLLINSGVSAKINPRPDMSFVRTERLNGETGKIEETIYLPGSSIKGVFRSRYEQVMKVMGRKVCKTFDKVCSDNIKNAKDGIESYEKCCEACKLFGTLGLAGRITFNDAYPVGKWALDTRHGVGIDRITGGSSTGALYDIETLTYGMFEVKCKLTNFELYQLRIVLWILEDINEGLVTFGMGGSRGSGQMRIADSAKVDLIYRQYCPEAPEIKGEEKEMIFGKRISISGLDEILAGLNMNSKDDIILAIPNKAVK